MNKPGQDESEALRGPLTGLPDVKAVRVRLEEWLAQGAASGEGATVHAMLLGVRRFDAINLAYGAAAGDGALAEVAARMSHYAASELDGPWLVARAGGGNFLLVANEACSRERWQLFADQLADAIARPVALPAGVLRLSPRVALLRGLHGESVESMLDRLGHALASAKRQQGRRLVWADGEITKRGRTTAELEADLLCAIDRDEIEILFQPQFSLADSRVTGAEALARWNHSQIGRIGAATLFSLAERTDHVTALTHHIARRAMEAARGWPEGLRLSLNVTPADLAAGSYVDELMKIVRETGFSAGRLTLEVTEQTLLQDINLAAHSLTELSGQGIRIALDDFGAGFCNFRYLKILPLDYLKLDRLMIDGITADQRDLAVLRAIIAMASALELKVIVEGVESEDQRQLVADEGCCIYQGYLGAKPMRAAKFLEMVNS